MNIRHATSDDFDALRALWEQWQSESPRSRPGPNELGGERARARAGAGRERALLRGGGREAVGFVTAGSGPRRQDRRPLRPEGGRGGKGDALVETVVENLRARGATHFFLNANLESLENCEARLPRSGAPRHARDRGE